MQAFNRNVKDVLLQITRTLPTTSGSNTSGTIDLGSLGTDSLPENLVVEIALPAMPLHVTAGNTLAIALWVGTTTTVAAPASPLPSIICNQIGIATDGTGIEVFRYKLPPGTPRYIGWRVTAGGTDDLQTYTATISILT